MESESSPSNLIVKANVEMFLKHQAEILAIERELIESSSSAYQIDAADEMDYMLDAFMHGGYSYLVMEGDIVTGFMVVGPLNDGTALPNAVTQYYPLEKCLIIKMMYIQQTGKRIGSAMMNKLLNEIDQDKWQYLFVRTWVDPPNEGAINFYTQHAGFELIPDSIVESTKTTVDGSGKFEIKRQYFCREV